MRCLFEVLATGIEMAKFPNRKNGGVDEVPFVWISGVDSDYMDQMIKIKIFRPKNLEALKALAQKGARLTIMFRTLKRDDQFEHCTVIVVNEGDIQPHVQAVNVQAAQAHPANGQSVQSQQPAMALAA